MARTRLGLTIVILLALISETPTAAQESPSIVDDYDQWKEALRTSQAVDPERYTAPEGFKIRLLRSAGPEEGSWVSLAFDPRGRLILARESGGLLRLTPPAKPGEASRIETINTTLGACRGLLFVEDTLYVNANNSKALYSVQDLDGDDQYETVTKLRSTGGYLGHGRNHLTLGPDGFLYLIHGNDVLFPDDYVQAGSPIKDYREDRLLPASWNHEFFDHQVRLPAGHVVRTAFDGERWDIVACGLRNPYGIAFNRDGEPFTFDADMEWDLGTPWYRPNRVNHIVSGADYGWRHGSSKWPSYFADTVPSHLDMGLASPTAVRFGYGARFPHRYREALFLGDWAYGRIIAVHLTPHGASYRCESEEFVKGRPLNVTDLVVGPDGAMYFTTGGRRTQSGLYRIDFVGDIPPDRKLTDVEHKARAVAAAARKTRRSLESFHGKHTPDAIKTAWPHLQSEDIWIVHAARIAIEHQPVDTWRDHALSETHPTAASQALLALARVGPPQVLGEWLDRFHALDWQGGSERTQEILLRALSVALLRLGQPADTQVSRLRDALESGYPTAFANANQILCELLVYLDSTVVVERTLTLLPRTPSQEETIGFLFSLRSARSGWTAKHRRRYLLWLHQAHEFEGGRDFQRFVVNIHGDAISSLTPEERQKFGRLAEPPQSRPVKSVTRIPTRAFVKDWELDDLVGSIGSRDKTPDLARGKRLFNEALCSACHQISGQGTQVGPDLTDVGRRFSQHDILRAVLMPSEVIAEKYRDTVVVDIEGNVTVGQIRGENKSELVLTPDATNPDKVVRVAIDKVVERSASVASPMPSNLLDTLTKDEILDLLAFLASDHGK